MPKVAYFANQFPSPVEPYVKEEIDALRQRGFEVVAGSARRPDRSEEARTESERALGMVVIQPLKIPTACRAVGILFRNRRILRPFIQRILKEGNERPRERLKALLHTWLGSYYAALLEGKKIEHIHVHHGYFGSWIAMVAAELLGVPYSLTLHGSDLLLRGAYLDTKLQRCAFCFTVSQYNRRYIARRYPEIEVNKIMVKRLGVDFPQPSCDSARPGVVSTERGPFSILSVGRLHAVKDHSFLVRACAQLKARDMDFECMIAGEGPERYKLEKMVRRYGLEDRVTLLGHVAHEQIDSLYARADVVVLTSRSEGIPLALMEAMARGRIVLAPAITGIPELVLPGKTGFLYEPGSLGDFVARLLLIHSLNVREDQQNGPRLHSAISPLDWVRHGARTLVLHNFNRETNLQSFADQFMQQTEHIHANPVLQ